MNVTEAAAKIDAAPALAQLLGERTDAQPAAKIVPELVDAPAAQAAVAEAYIGAPAGDLAANTIAVAAYAAAQAGQARHWSGLPACAAHGLRQNVQTRVHEVRQRHLKAAAPRSLAGARGCDQQ